MMLLTLDNLAHRYNLLPSEALSRASTFDLRVMDIRTNFDRKQYEEDQARREGKPVPSKKLTQEQMLSMIEQVRKQNDQG